MVSNLSVLLTDEKDDATLKLASVLRGSKMDVRLCSKNGAELLKLYEEFHPEVIIMMLSCSILMLWVSFHVLI